MHKFMAVREKMINNKYFIVAACIMSLTPFDNASLMEEQKPETSKKRKMLEETEEKAKKLKELDDQLEEQEQYDLVQYSINQWNQKATRIAETWGQSLEEYEKEAREFLADYRKKHPNEMGPANIMELALLSKPKRTYASDIMEEYIRNNPQKRIKRLPPGKFGVPLH